MNRPDILLCPNCSSTLDYANETLICSACRKTYEKSNKDQYHNLLTKVPSASQDPEEQASKSLLIHQVQDFYSSEAFKKFVLNISDKRISNEIKKLKPDILVDLGCGSGANSKLVIDNCGFYIGIEPSEIPNPINPKDYDSNRMLLVRNNPEKPLPIQNDSVDVLMFMASYDHIDHRDPVIKEAYRVLKPGGYMYIYMTNYGFWMKRLVNFVRGKRLFLNEHEHFVVHDPDTLKKEIDQAQPGFQITSVISDDRMLPNLPAKFSILYKSAAGIRVLNKLTRLLIKTILRVKNPGADMSVVLQKQK